MKEEAVAALQWYIDAGVDEAIDDAPRNYFAIPNPIPSPLAGESQGGGYGENTGHEDIPPSLILSHKGGGNSSIPLPSSLTAAMAEARAMADAADSLEALKKAVHGFDGCAIKRTATKTVFADGNPKSRLMLIGEAPGAQEDIQGIPFCGPSGILLDKMFAAIGYNRNTFYITNTLFWRPPGNRQPNSEELAICKPFVEKHIALIDPLMIVLVGGTATKSVLGTEQGITRLRGKNFTYRTPYKDKEYPVSVIYHPSYLLRQPAQKRATWQDLLAIKKQMEAFHIQ